MLVRCLLPGLLFLACAPATLPVAAPSARAAAPAATNVAHAARPHRARHVARLAPPFASAGGTRHLADGDVPTAVAATP